MHEDFPDPRFVGVICYVYFQQQKSGRCCLLRLGQISKIRVKDLSTHCETAATPVPSGLGAGFNDRDTPAPCPNPAPPPYPYGIELELRRSPPQRNQENRHEGITLRDLILRGRKNSANRAATPRTRPGSSSSPALGQQVLRYAFA